MFDINKFKNLTEVKTGNQFNSRMAVLKSKGIDTNNIEEAVNEASRNVANGNNSFVIYGEPQSGKTEMMIGLTAKLLDQGHKIIIVLLNDNVQLLGQNLLRFQEADINPSPVNFEEVLLEEIGAKEWVIFCKKNNSNLKKLINKLHGKKNRIVIDDEADYATPNSKINKQKRSAINESVYKLLGENGTYIGVTATPARLDLNNTFNNLSEKWIQFKAHKEYIGKDVFFPINPTQERKFVLQPMPPAGDHPVYLRKALFSFFVNVALLNFKSERQNYYSFLVHTSGKKADQSVDHKHILKFFDVLRDQNHKNYNSYVRELYIIAEQRHEEPNEIVMFILKNISRKVIVLINSDHPGRMTDPTSPPALFTVAIGGNIVSRGVTFENLLSMFFTRDVKHKLQQDTYIQRARMFGNRAKYIRFFELWIPEKLYVDWQRCFVYHHLALESIKTVSEAPVWLADSRIQPAASTSIDKTLLSIDNGEMAFRIFDFNPAVRAISEKSKEPIEVLKKINLTQADEVIPSYLIEFIAKYSSNWADVEISIGEPDYSKSHKDGYDPITLLRKKGVFGGTDTKNKTASHFIRIVRNKDTNKARVVYKNSGKIQFLKKTR